MELPGVGHFVHVERPGEVAELALGFLAELR
jgi:pimeloyl-ACP methyl ester carboxylesterase